MESPGTHWVSGIYQQSTFLTKKYIGRAQLRHILYKYILRWSFLRTYMPSSHSDFVHDRTFIVPFIVDAGSNLNFVRYAIYILTHTNL